MKMEKSKWIEKWRSEKQANWSIVRTVRSDRSELSIISKDAGGTVTHTQDSEPSLLFSTSFK